MGRKFLWYITVTINEFFLSRVHQALPINLIEHFWHSFSKFLCISKTKMTAHDFWHLISFFLPLIIVGRQNYFYQNFCLEKTFQWYETRHTFQFEILKLPPSTSLGGADRSSIFASTDSSSKNIECVFFDISIQGLFLEMFDRFHLFVTPGIFEHIKID